MEQLEGKVVVVTGGASGIGLAMASRFHAAGMRAVLGDVEEDALAVAVKGLGGEDAGVLGIACDVTSPDAVAGLRDAALDRFGAVHVVCLNAGVAASGTLLHTTLESWRWMLDVNVLGVVHGIHAFGPGLVEQGEGHIVCTASAAGLVSAPALGAYSATKHAVVGMAAVLRDELAADGVGVSVVCPGVVRTRIFESERNRPPGLAGPTHADGSIAEIYAAAAENAPGPELVADAVHDAVIANRFFVLPSPEISPMVRARVDEVLAALPSRG